MKHPLFHLALALLLLCACHEQHVTATAPSAGTIPGYPAKMNVLYMGMINPVTIGLHGVARSEIDVTCSLPGTHIADSLGYFQVTPTQAGNCRLYVKRKNSDGSLQLLDSISLRVKKAPDPVIHLGQQKGEALIDLTQPLPHGLFAMWENFDFDAWAKINAFEMSYLDEGQWKSTKANGPMLTAQMQALLAHARSGDRFIISNVSISLSDGTTRNVPGLTIRIK